jgi:hypothetical protein
VVSIAKDLAPKTETTVDDRIVDALEKAISNPVIFELLLSVLFDSEGPSPVSASDDETVAAMTLSAHADVVKGLFALAA